LELTTDYCVHLNSDLNNLGKWIDVPCAVKALVMCQKEQIWSNAVLKALVQLLRKNPVPIGFVYVQLPMDKSPTEIYPELIYPDLIWTDVTAQYEGLFFRAGGGNAEAFGTIQEADSPRLSGIQYHAGGGDNSSVSVCPGTWSLRVRTGGRAADNDGMNVLVTDAEVRPRNMAMKVWKRIE